MKAPLKPGPPLAILGVVLLLLLARPVAVTGTLGRSPAERRMFRAYFRERAQVHALAAWHEPWEVNYEAGYLVVAANAGEAERLRRSGFRLELDRGLTQTLARARQKEPGQTAGIPGYACYRTVEETFATGARLALSYPHLATWVDIGDSWQKWVSGESGFEIQVLRLTNAAVPGPKPGLFLMSSIHAREYAPAEINTRFAEYLLEHYGSDADVTWLLDYHTIHLLFQGNPDGRKYAEAGILWRKNVNEAYCGVDSSDRGADLNRNFPFQWGCCNASSSDPCSPVYRGPAPASEPETQAVTDYVKAHFPDQRAPELSAAAPLTATGVFLDLHSYGEWVLWPWGFTAQPAPNGPALTTLGRRLAYYNGYYPSQAAGLYPTDGTTDDFGYGELGLAAFTFEVGDSFFQDCATFEEEIWPDNLAALLYAARVAGAPYRTPAGPMVVGNALQPVTGAGAYILTATVDDGHYSSRNGVEAVQPIAAAQYSIDLPPWLSSSEPSLMFAVDGNFDNVRESVTARIDTTTLVPGRHTLFLRAQDGDGNWGEVRALFLEVEADLDGRTYLPVVGK